jgi:hypothetical protein
MNCETLDGGVLDESDSESLELERRDFGRKQRAETVDGGVLDESDSETLNGESVDLYGKILDGRRVWTRSKLGTGGVLDGEILDESDSEILDHRDLGQKRIERQPWTVNGALFEEGAAVFRRAAEKAWSRRGLAVAETCGGE